MKKFIFLSIVFILLLSLFCACGKETENIETEGTSESIGETGFETETVSEKDTETESETEAVTEEEKATETETEEVTEKETESETETEKVTETEPESETEKKTEVDIKNKSFLEIKGDLSSVKDIKYMRIPNGVHAWYSDRYIVLLTDEKEISVTDILKGDIVFKDQALSAGEDFDIVYSKEDDGMIFRFGKKDEEGYRSNFKVYNEYILREDEGNFSLEETDISPKYPRIESRIISEDGKYKAFLVDYGDGLWGIEVVYPDGNEKRIAESICSKGPNGTIYPESGEFYYLVGFTEEHFLVLCGKQITGTGYLAVYDLEEEKFLDLPDKNEYIFDSMLDGKLIVKDWVDDLYHGVWGRYYEVSLDGTMKELIEIPYSSPTNEKTITDIKFSSDKCFIRETIRKNYDLISRISIWSYDLSEKYAEIDFHEDECTMYMIEIRQGIKIIVKDRE